MTEPTCTAWEPEWCCDVTDVKPEKLDLVLEAATLTLWAASGRRFGYCTTPPLRPCARQASLPLIMGFDYWTTYGPGFGPVLYAGEWFNVTCGAHGDGCSCTAVESVQLPVDVVEIVEVVVDGDIVPTGSYRVDNRRTLVRQDGDRWPICQDLSTPLGEVGTWSVEVVTGEPVPSLGQLAVGELACDMLAGCAGDACHIPRKVQDMITRGVSVHLRDLDTLLDRGLIGLDWCDQFITAVNPDGLRQQSRMYSIDVPPPRGVW